MRGTLLLVDDNPDDVFLMRRAWTRAGFEYPVQVANDGEEATEYLSGSNQYGDRSKYPLPSLVLLDLKLPRKSGREVLEWVREQEPLKRLVVVILTTSRDPRDVNAAYELGANAYLVKPSTSAELVQMMIAFKAFWYQHNQFAPILCGWGALDSGTAPR